MYIPEPPIPAITLPTMSAFIVGAAPHSVDPASNSTTLPMNTFLMSNLVYSADLNIWRE
jgi:hypothetical protein